MKFTLPYIKIIILTVAVAVTGFSYVVMKDSPSDVEVRTTKKQSRVSSTHQGDTEAASHDSPQTTEDSHAEHQANSYNQGVVLARLEALSADPKQQEEFKELLLETFTGNGSKAEEQAILKAALNSRDERVQDIARSLSFIGQVEEVGFAPALNQAEESLGFDGDEEGFLDFIADEVASQNPLGTLDWLEQKGPGLWEDALPLVLADWAAEDQAQAGAWVNNLDAGNFRDLAIAEFAPIIATESPEQAEALVSEIGDEDIQQEARIRTGKINFSALGDK